MAMFDIAFDLAARRKEAEEARKREEAKRRLFAMADLAGAAPTEREVNDYVTGGGVIDPLAKVTGANPVADMQAEMRAEELQRSVAESAPQAAALREAVLLAELGVNPAQVASARDTEARRRALFDVLPKLATPGEQASALNSDDVSAYRFSEAGAGNRFTGAFDASAALDALAEQRRAAAGASQATARDRNSSAALRDFRRQALEQVLSVPTDPAAVADIANAKPVFKPERVKVRRKDGTEAYYDATPNLTGGFTYSPAAAGAEQLTSAPDPTGDGRTALQKDTAFIAEVMGIPINDAILWKLQTGRKPAAEAWAETVTRVMSANRHMDPQEVNEKARAIWGYARPGEPVPTTAASPAPGASVDPDTDLMAQARDALARGAPRAAVEARLRQYGLDPAGL